MITFPENARILLTKNFLLSLQTNTALEFICIYGRQNNYNQIYPTPAAVDVVINTELMPRHILTTTGQEKQQQKVPVQNCSKLEICFSSLIIDTTKNKDK